MGNLAPTADVNPYAAPAVPDALLAEQDLQIAWRDGRFLVVHRSGSVLPSICIRTGVPANRFHRVRVAWTFPIDISTRTLHLDVPLSDVASADLRRWKLGSGATALAAAVAIFGLLNSGDLLPTSVFPFLMTACVGVLLAVPIVSSRMLQILSFRRVRGNHLWLAGAAPQFLDQLPPWPGHGG